MAQIDSSTLYDLLVIGAGPTGLACAIEAQKVGFRVLVVDKGCLCNSIFHYPAHMTFFTTPELLEIGDMPFSSPNQKPTRNEALEYYRKVTEHYGLDVRQYETVMAVEGADGDFSGAGDGPVWARGGASCAQGGAGDGLLRSAELSWHPG